MKKLLVILGPTATGKTDLARSLAKKFNGELISCDSRQVYQGLDIGTGKMTSKNLKVIKGNRRWIVGGMNIWMYDVVSPKIRYTVAEYMKDTREVIKEIKSRNKLPIIVGGTGLYLKALLYGLSHLSVPVDKNLRRELEKLSKEQLQKKLKKLSSQKWEKLNSSDKENPRRLVRAIELEVTPEDADNWIPAYAGMTGLKSQNYNTLMIGLTAPRGILYKRADERVVNRLDQGMIEEAEKLQEDGLSLKRMKQLGLEYGVLADYLAGQIRTRQDLIKIMQGKIHGFVRRQLTWFKKDQGIFWFDITSKDFPKNVEKMTGRWYHHHHAAKN